MSEVVCKPESLRPGRPFAPDGRKCAAPAKSLAVWAFSTDRRTVGCGKGTFPPPFRSNWHSVLDQRGSGSGRRGCSRQAQSDCYWVLVARTSNATDEAGISSSTDWGFEADSNKAIFFRRNSASTRWFSCRSDNAWRPISATPRKLLETGAKSLVRNERFSSG